jgi:hypothetical protein
VCVGSFRGDNASVRSPVRWWDAVATMGCIHDGVYAPMCASCARQWTIKVNLSFSLTVVIDNMGLAKRVNRTTTHGKGFLDSGGTWKAMQYVFAIVQIAPRKGSRTSSRPSRVVSYQGSRRTWRNVAAGASPLEVWRNPKI